MARVFVLGVLASACLAWWIVVPAATLWAAGELVGGGPAHVVAGIIGVPLTMVLTAPILFWLNGLYLRVTGVAARLAEDEEAVGWRRSVAGPLEPLLVGAFAVTVVAFAVWFVLFAKNPGNL